MVCIGLHDAFRIEAASAMDKERTSINEAVADHKAPLHLQTVDADVDLDLMYGEDRKAKEKALVRKVDMRMMPLMMLICKPAHYIQIIAPLTRH